MGAVAFILIVAAAAFDTAALDDVVQQTPGIVAVVVDSGGEPVYARQVRPGSTRGPRKEAIDGLHDIRSAGKSITALAVGAAIADGHLASVDVAVWPLLGVTEGPHQGIRVRDLLTMSSSLACDDWQGRRSPGFEERMYRHRNWVDFASRLPADPAYERNADGFGRFAYCTAGVFLLGQVVQAATGEPFDAYVRRRLFEPLGVGEVVWRRSRSGEVQAGGQLQIAATDLAKLGRLVLDGGRWQGEQVLPEAWIEQMLQPWRAIGPDGYGYLWWSRMAQGPQGAERLWFMRGNGGNLVVLIGSLDTVVVVQAANYNDPAATEVSFAVVTAALTALGPDGRSPVGSEAIP